MKHKLWLSNLDFWGMTASLLCAIHCLSLPILLTFTSLGIFTFLENPWFEFMMFSIALCIASTSLLTDYFKYHRNFVPLKWALLGFLLIGIGFVWVSEFWEPFFSGIGGLLVAISHVLNWRIRKGGK